MEVAWYRYRFPSALSPLGQVVAANWFQQLPGDLALRGIVAVSKGTHGRFRLLEATYLIP